MMGDPIVTLSADTKAQGSVRYATENLRGVNCFLGIPYAAPPVGKLRFQPPQSCDLWHGTRKCTDFGPVCPQNIEAARRHIPFQKPPLMNEDCLYLNVYTPNIKSTARLPVMVWIHGGGFMSGFSNNFEGTSLCNFHDVVIVSINYRLGPFGFMVTGESIRGNMGLMDQVEALKWVQKHIDKFGGDPQNVTIFGESAGGMSCGFHLLSSLSKGLFKRAICQSGVLAFSSLMWPMSGAKKYTFKQMKKRGFKGANENEILEYLQKVSTEDLIPSLEDYFCPVMDGSFFTEMPVNLYSQGKFQKNVDVMIGFNTHEGALFIHRMIGKEPFDNLDAARKIINNFVDVSFLRGRKNREIVKDLIIREYLKDAVTEDDYLKGIIEAYGDILFVAPAMYCAKQHAEKSNGSTYVYHFTHKLPYSPYKRQWIGADHLEEIPYVFGQPFKSHYPGVWNTDHKEFSKNIMSLWCNFAATGNPNGSILSDWPQHSAEKGEYMILQPHFQASTNYKTNRVYLWNEVIPLLTEQLKSKY